MYSKEERIQTIINVNRDFGINAATKNFTSNIYYLNRQYNTGTTKLNNWLSVHGHNFKVSKPMISYLHNGKRSNLNFMFIFIYTAYYNAVFNLNMQPYELITFDFELCGKYVNPNRRKDLRYNRVKRVV